MCDASDGGVLGRVLAHLERGAAAACGDDVGVVDLEPRPLEAFDVVDLGTEDELHADLVDDDRDAAVLEDVILFLGLVEGERVLEARAAAAPHGHAQGLALGAILSAEKLPDLLRGAVGEAYRCRGCIRHRFTNDSCGPVAYAEGS